MLCATKLLYIGDGVGVNLVNMQQAGRKKRKRANNI